MTLFPLFYFFFNLSSIVDFLLLESILKGMKEGISKRQATRKKGNRTSLLNTTRNKKGNENQKTKRIVTKDKGKKKIDQQELAPRKSLKEQGQHLKVESESVMQSEIPEELQEGTSTPTKVLTKTTKQNKTQPNSPSSYHEFNDEFDLHSNGSTAREARGRLCR